MYPFSKNNGIDSPSDKASAPPQKAKTAQAGAKQSRLSNTAIVTPEKPSLLHFGLDWLVLFIRIGNASSSPLLEFLEGLFDYDQDEFFEVPDLKWPNMDLTLSARFGKGKGDKMAYLKFEGDPVIAIRKVTATSTFPLSITNNYGYQITFYGEFFALAKHGKFDIQSCLFAVGASESYIVSLIHICADIENITTKKVLDGIKRLSVKQTKKTSILNQDPVTGLPETVYYGEKGDANWMARIYDKLLEIKSSKKQRVYPQYWGKELLTRIEIVLKRPVCKKFNVTITQCLDDSFLLSLFTRHLQGKYVEWDIMPFIEMAMQEKGYKSRKLEIVRPDYNKLKEEQHYRRLQAHVIRFCEAYRQNPVVVLREMTRDFETATPLAVWK